MVPEFAALQVTTAVVAGREQAVFAVDFQAGDDAGCERVLNADSPGLPAPISGDLHVAAGIDDVVANTILLQQLAYQADRVALGDTAEVDLQVGMTAAGALAVDDQVVHAGQVPSQGLDICRSGRRTMKAIGGNQLAECGIEQSVAQVIVMATELEQRRQAAGYSRRPRAAQRGVEAGQIAGFPGVPLHAVFVQAGFDFLQQAFGAPEVIGDQRNLDQRTEFEQVLFDQLLAALATAQQHQQQ